MAYVPVDVYVTDSTVQNNPTPGVVVRVFSQDGKLVYTQVETDSAGHAGFLLPSGMTFQVRFYKFGVGFTNPKYIQIQDTNNVFDVKSFPVTAPIPNDGRLCTAFGFFRSPDGGPAPNVDMHFIPKFKPLILDGAACLIERVETRTDDTGYVQINLIRNGQYDVTLQGMEDFQRCISVPDLPNVNLPDLLFPRVSKITFDQSTPITLSLGQQLQVRPTVFTSDGNEDLDGAYDVTWSTDNSSIVGLTIAGGVLTLFGAGVGTANIIAERNDNSIVSIPALPIVGIPLQVTVQ